MRKLYNTPFVTLHDPGALWRLATRKWAEIEAKSPDLGPALVLQQRLVGLMIDAAASLDGIAPLDMTSDDIAASLTRGLPVLRSEQTAIPPRLTAFLPSICTALAEGGAGDSAAHIGDAIARYHIDAVSLLSVSLARNQKAMRTSALHMGFSPDLVWLIGELGSSPLAHHLQHLVLRSAPRTGTGVSPRSGFLEWDRGYCPFCGSWPVFIELVEGRRLLRCSYCALGWTLTTERCIYCGNSGDGFLAAALDVGQPGRRVELCAACGNYTKVLEAPAPTPFPLLAIDDLATMPLDAATMERGYRRPELFDLDTIEPRKSC
jgi:FdhE protein